MKKQFSESHDCVGVFGSVEHLLSSRWYVLVTKLRANESEEVHGEAWTRPEKAVPSAFPGGTTLGRRFCTCLFPFRALKVSPFGDPAGTAFNSATIGRSTLQDGRNLAVRERRQTRRER